MNDKDRAVWEVLEKIYDGAGECVYTQAEIDTLNEAFKKAYGKLNISEFRSIIPLTVLLDREQSVLSEIKDAFESDRALMSGALSECNLSATIADILGLNERVIIKGESASVPEQMAKMMRRYNIEKCRYIYYDKDDMSVVLFQCGAPDLCDAFLIYGDIKINIEYKERMAKAGEYDLDHDSAGRLLVPAKVRSAHPEVVKMVDGFNRETNLFKEIGHNYQDFDARTRVECIGGYFRSKEIDILVSIDEDDKIIAIIPAWIDLNLDERIDAFHVIETNGSEIRTTGRNPARIICLDHFRKVFNDAGGLISVTGNCSIKNGNSILRIAKGRGTGHPSKLKIMSIYEVPLKDKGYGVATLSGGVWLFNLRSVRQKRPTVSPHITIIATRQQIKNHFDF